MSGKYPNQGFNPPLVLTAEEISAAMVGTETNGSILVSCGQDLQPQATLVARVLEQTITEAEQTVAAPLPVRPHLFLLRMAHERRVVQFSLMGSQTNGWRTMPWLTLLTNSPPETALGSAPAPEAIWSDLREFPMQIFLITHELFEMHLIDPEELLVMGDFSGNVSFIRFTLKYHTRWFRDGLANYFAYQANRSFRRQAAKANLKPGTLRFIEKPKQPLSELAEVKDKVFDWNQNSSIDYYDAATGLFFLIEQRHGPEAITAIINELPKVKFPDGKSLLKMIRQITGINLRQQARTFQFPKLGLETQLDTEGRCEIQNVAPNSWAAKANLQRGDLLLEANTSPLGSRTDLEVQVLKALEDGNRLSLIFSRKGERHVTEPLPLPDGRAN